MRERREREIQFRKLLTETHKQNLDHFLLYEFIDNALKQEKNVKMKLKYHHSDVVF